MSPVNADVATRQCRAVSIEERYKIVTVDHVFLDIVMGQPRSSVLESVICVDDAQDALRTQNVA